MKNKIIAFILGGIIGFLLCLIGVKRMIKRGELTENYNIKNESNK